MSQQRLKDILPFFSVLIFVATLFALVLAKMEVRRMGLSNELQQAITGSVAVRENPDGTATAPTFPGTSPQQPSNLADLARQELERRKNGSK